MIVYFGTVFRTAPPQQGGELIKLDLSKKEVLAKQTIAPWNPDIVDDPNPRGQARGCRGIEIIDDKIIAASYHSLEIFDMDLNKIRTVSNGLMVGLHEMFYQGDQKLLVTSTAIDGAFLVDLNNGDILEQYWPREIAAYQQKFNISPLEIDKAADNRLLHLTVQSKGKLDPEHLHLNAVTKHNGDIFGLFNRFGAVVNLSKNETVLHDPRIKGAHNLIFLDDNTVMMNGTYRASVLAFDINTKKLVNRFKLSKYKPVRKITGWDNMKFFIAKAVRKLKLVRSPISVKPLFVRGLCVTKDFIFVGISPATILCINRKTKKLEDYYTYSNEVKLAVHGLKVAESDRDNASQGLED